MQIMARLPFDAGLTVPSATSAARDDAMRFNVVRDEAGLAALLPHWRALAARSHGANLHCGPDWLHPAWTGVARPRGHRLHILVGWRGASVVLIWPMVRDGAFLGFLSSGRTEYHDLLVEDGLPDTAIEAAWRHMASQRGVHALMLPDLRADSRMAGLVAHLAPASYRVTRRTWLIHLDRHTDFDSYWATRPPRLIADQRRQWRRAAELPGGVRFEIAEDPATQSAWLDWFFAAKLDWMRGRGIATQDFADPGYRRFMGDVADAAHARGDLLIARLATGDATMAVAFGFVDGGRFLFQSFTYDPEFGRLSPARLLLERLVRWCFERGLAEFDFMPGDQEYKAQWSDGELPVIDHHVPIGVIGRAKLAWHASGLATLARHPGLRALYQRLPPSIRRRLRDRVAVNLDYTTPIEPPR